MSVLLRTIPITDEWAQLTAQRTVLDTSLVAPAGNAGPVLVRFDGAPAEGAAIQAGATIEAGVVNAARIEIKGEEGDTLTLIGRTPPPKGVRA